jgi:hypothetical protein
MTNFDKNTHVDAASLPQSTRATLAWLRAELMLDRTETATVAAAMSSDISGFETESWFFELPHVAVECWSQFSLEARVSLLVMAHRMAHLKSRAHA